MGAHAAAGILLSATIAVCVFRGAPPDPQAVSALYLAATVAALLGAIFSTRMGALNLIVAFYFFAFVAIPATVQTRRAHFPFGSTYSDAELIGGFALVSLAQLALMTGIATAGLRGNPAAPATSVPRPTQSEGDSARARRLALAFAGAGAVLAALAGPTYIFSARFDDVRSALAEEGIAGQLVHVARAFALVGLLLSVLALKFAASPDSRRRARNVVLLTSCVALAVNFPPALPRFQLLALVLAVLVLLLDFRRPAVKLVFSGAAALFLLFVFSAIKDLRDGVSIQVGTRQRLGDYLITADFDSFKQVVDTLLYFSGAPHRGGDNFLGAALFWIPRSIWPDKPIHTGQIVSEGLGYPYNNVSNPLPAEGYASWGVVGTVIVMLLVGLLIGRLEGRGTKVPGTASIPRWIDYALATGYATILLRGALNAVAPMIFTAFALAVVVHLVFRKHTQEQTRTRRTRVQEMGRR